MTQSYNDFIHISKQDKKNVSFLKVWIALIFLFLIFGGIIYSQVMRINKLSEQLSSSQKIYVYDLQDALRGLKIDILNAEFETKINILNQEVISAQDKISSLKDHNVKENFSDVYLNSLKMKRDSMIKDYNEALQDITAQINDNLVKIAEEKNTPTIFNKQAVSAMTPNVVDLTQELVEKIKIRKARDLLK